MQTYTIATDTWATLAMPPGFGGSLIAIYNRNHIYFCGGITNAVTVNTCGIYSLQWRVFSAMASLPVGVNHAAFACDGAKIYVAGGR